MRACWFGPRLPALGALFASSVWLVAGPGSARAAVVGLELEWTAPEDCPGETEVLAAIERLAGERKSVLTQPLAVAARVETIDWGYRLELSWRTASARAVRQVEAATCGELVQATAVIVALASDPLSEEPATPVAEAVPDSVPTPKNDPTATASRPTGGSEEPSALPAHPFELGLRLSPAIDLGSLPRASPGMFAGVELRGPLLELGLELGTFVPAQASVPEGAGRFWLSLALLRPCAALVPSPLTVAPCAAVEADLMHGTGRSVDFPEGGFAWFLRFGGGLELRSPLSSGLELTAGGLLLGAPSRPSFVVGDGALVHRPAAWSGRFWLGFAYRP